MTLLGVVDRGTRNPRFSEGGEEASGTTRRVEEEAEGREPYVHDRARWFGRGGGRVPSIKAPSPEIPRPAYAAARTSRFSTLNRSEGTKSKPPTYALATNRTPRNERIARMAEGTSAKDSDVQAEVE